MHAKKQETNYISLVTTARDFVWKAYTNQEKDRIILLLTADVSNIQKTETNNSTTTTNTTDDGAFYFNKWVMKWSHKRRKHISIPTSYSFKCRPVSSTHGLLILNVQNFEIDRVN